MRVFPYVVSGFIFYHIFLLRSSNTRNRSDRQGCCTWSNCKNSRQRDLFSKLAWLSKPCAYLDVCYPGRKLAELLDFILSYSLYLVGLLLYFGHIPLIAIRDFRLQDHTQPKLIFQYFNHLFAIPWYDLIYAYPKHARLKIR